MPDRGAADREVGDRAYFALPGAGWEAVPLELRERLIGMRSRLDAVLDGQAARGVPSPAELAMQLGEAATALFDAVSPDERSLRQVITTLRTGLALCWDMYSYAEAGRTSVQAHMDRLRAEISAFEADLRGLDEDLAGQASGT